MRGAELGGGVGLEAKELGDGPGKAEIPQPDSPVTPNPAPARVPRMAPGSTEDGPASTALPVGARNPAGSRMVSPAILVAPPCQCRS